MLLLVVLDVVVACKRRLVIRSDVFEKTWRTVWERPSRSGCAPREEKRMAKQMIY